MIINGRQIAPTLDGIRDDHVARYSWAAGRLDGEAVLDLGCGCGYGAAILAEKAKTVVACDGDPDAIAYAKANWSRPNIEWRITAAERLRLPAAKVVTAFEVVEHLEDPLPLLSKIARRNCVLLGSVPNENVIPFARANNPFHVRHFTPEEIGNLLIEAGFGTIVLNAQAGKMGRDAAIVPIASAVPPRTIVFEAF